MATEIEKVNDTRGPTGLVVLGMHRSGTSLAARLAGELGCSFGGDLMPAKDDNPMGFFEHAEVVEIHDDFLADLGRTWSDPRAWTSGAFEGPEAARARQRIQEVFDRDFARSPRWTLKDPRLCRLLPLWERVLAGSGHRLAFLHVARNPLDISRSLARRNGLSEASSLVLWIRHVLEAERWTRGRSRAWVEFDRLLETPKEEMRRAVSRMGVDDAFDFDRANDSLVSAVSNEHVHHRGAEDLRDRDWFRIVRTAVQRLWECESTDAHADLDRVAAELVRAQGQTFMAGHVDLLGHEMSEQRGLVAKLEDVSEKARNHLSKLETEISSLVAYSQSLEQRLAQKSVHEESLASYVRKLEALISMGGE